MQRLLELAKNSDLWRDVYDVDVDEVTVSYLRMIWNRIHSLKFNFLGMATGKHRVGKSLSTLVFSYVLDKTFWDNMEKRVVYFPEDFMRALIDLQKNKIIGGAIIWDEAGIGIPAREWYEISNKAISYALQVFGYLRPIVYFVTQDITYIDSQPRKLFHGFYEMQRIGNKYSIAKPFVVSYNKRTGKVYYVYPRYYLHFDGGRGRKLILNRLLIGKPPDEFIERYEMHSFPFKEKIMEQMQERAEKFVQGRIPSRKMTIQEIITDILSNRVDDKRLLTKRSTEGHKIFDADAISIEYGIPQRLARIIKRRVEIEANKIPEDKQILDKPPNE